MKNTVRFAQIFPILLLAGACGLPQDGTPLENVEPAWRFVEQVYGYEIPMTDVQGIPRDPSCDRNGAYGLRDPNGYCTGGYTERSFHSSREAIRILLAGELVGGGRTGPSHYWHALPHEMAHRAGHNHYGRDDWDETDPVQIAIRKAQRLLEATPEIDIIRLAGEKPATH